eukprot:scaffold34324_cov23-Tisochrysis_lutea.AAC.1
MSEQRFTAQHLMCVPRAQGCEGKGPKASISSLGPGPKVSCAPGACQEWLSRVAQTAWSNSVKWLAATAWSFCVEWLAANVLSNCVEWLALIAWSNSMEWLAVTARSSSPVCCMGDGRLRRVCSGLLGQLFAAGISAETLCS